MVVYLRSSTAQRMAGMTFSWGLLLAYASVWTLEGAIGNRTVDLKCFPIPDAIANSPAAIAGSWLAASLKMSQFITDPHPTLTPLYSHWEETRCLARTMSQRNMTAEKLVTLFKLQQVILDLFLHQLNKRGCRQDVLRFIQSVGIPEGYGFLVQDIRKFTLADYSSTLLYEMAFFMKKDPSFTPELQARLLPTNLRLILESRSPSKSVYLRNEASGRCLSLANRTFSSTKECEMSWKFVPALAFATLMAKNSSVPTYFHLYSSASNTKGSTKSETGRYFPVLQPGNTVVFYCYPNVLENPHHGRCLLENGLVDIKRPSKGEQCTSWTLTTDS